jgi:hypothetical protein
MEPGSPWENGCIENWGRSSTRYVAGGSDHHHRELATSLQHDRIARIARLQTAGTRSVLASLHGVAPLHRWAPPALLASPPILNQHSTRTTQ